MFYLKLLFKKFSANILCIIDGGCIVTNFTAQNVTFFTFVVISKFEDLFKCEIWY